MTYIRTVKELVSLWIFLAIKLTLANQACQKEYFNSTSFVCTCDVNYCDEFTYQIHSNQVTHVYSDMESARFDTVYLDFDVNSPSQTADVNIKIDMANEKQKIVGFGGAMTDASAIMISKLPENMQEMVLNSYFNVTHGINYEIVRNNMAGCDFSVRPYTYCDECENDFTLSDFALAEEDLDFKIPIYQKIKNRYNPKIKFMASPWTAPNWMKTNNQPTGQGKLKGKPGDQYHKAWALYFIKFLEAYDAYGINYWAVTMQNEPINGLFNVAKWQQLAWTPWTQRDWLKLDLLPAIENSYFRDLEVIILDDQRFELPLWANIVLSEGNENSTNVAGIGVHWYWDDIYPAKALTKTHNNFPDKYIIGTEACNKLRGGSAIPYLGSWEFGENYSNDILEDLANFAGGWVDWNMALNLEGKPNWAGNSDDSPIIIDPDNKKFYKNPMFYHLGHFSKFIKQNWVVIGSGGKNVKTSRDGKLRLDLPHPDRASPTVQAGKDKNIKWVIAKSPPNSNEIPKISIVLLNTSSSSVKVSFSDLNLGSFSQTVNARSINSFIYEY